MIELNKKISGRILLEGCARLVYDRSSTQRLPQQPAPQLVQPQSALQVQASGLPLQVQLHAGAEAQQEQLASAPSAPNAVNDTTSAVAPTAIRPISVRISVSS
jgi:hypothetical protein